MDKITGRIIATRHAGTSSVGNPKITVCVDTGTSYHIVDIAPNAGIAYAIQGHLYRDRLHTFTLNKRGQITSATA